MGILGFRRGRVRGPELAEPAARQAVEPGVEPGPRDPDRADTADRPLPTDAAAQTGPAPVDASVEVEPTAPAAASASTPQDASPPQPPLPAARGPYANSEEHLWHALAWADQLVRAQTLRWRRTIAASKPEPLWGMIQVTDAEVSAFLRAPFMRPDELPESLIADLHPYWDAVARIAADINARLEETPAGRTLRLVELGRGFGLSPYEVGVLLVCLLAQLDGRYRRLYGYLQDDASRTRPSVELVLEILQPLAPVDEPARDLLNAAAPLRAWHLIQVTDTSGVNDPLGARALQVDTRILDYLLGSDRPDGRLGGVLTEPARSGGIDALLVEADAREQLIALKAWLQTLPPDSARLPTLFLHGAYGSGKRDCAAALCAELGLPLLIADTRAALRAPDGWRSIIELALREARLRGAALCWTGTQSLRESEGPRDDWDDLIAACEDHPGLVLLASETPWDPAGRYRRRPFVRLDLPSPSYALRCRIWEVALPEPPMLAEIHADRGQLCSILANGFQLTAGQIADAVATARGVAMRRDPARPRLALDDLYEGCRRQSSRGLITFARLIEPRTDLSFDDLILPEPNKRQLDELRARMHYRSRVYSGLGFERRLSLGKGLIALFTGSSGTGKTMAAELLGREYGMQIFKIDLAAVVSKYVGETEKNLSRVFNEAEDANAILFFDEGEALFGKRGEVKEARDRWANTEVNFLLQRIEEYRGVVIITTNLRQNMDAAFMRRIQVAVDFPRPAAEARMRIWKGMFPQGVARPSDDELRALAAQFTLSGGNIKNAVIDAAFRAVADAGPEGPVITIRHLVLGIAREEQKMGRALTKGDFGETYFAMLETEILA
jgi:hypothetical protein